MKSDLQSARVTMAVISDRFLSINTARSKRTSSDCFICDLELAEIKSTSNSSQQNDVMP